MITICHLGMSQSDRIVWLMEELGLPYELEWYTRGEDFLSPPEFRALHPAATAPIIKDGDVVLPEALAIVDYITQKYAGGKLSVAPTESNYADYLYWMQINSNLQSAIFCKMAAGEDADAENGMLKSMQRRLDGYFNAAEQRLGEVPYLAGEEFTNTEIMAMFPLTMMTAFAGLTLDQYPNITAYVARVGARSAYIKAQELAGPAAEKPA